jgi:hypothetical protein
MRATARWRKSSRSGTGTNCVEVEAGLLMMRDSKDPHGRVLAFGSRAALAALVAKVRT